MESLIKWVVRKFVRMMGWSFVALTFACSAALIGDISNNRPNIQGGIIATTFFAVGAFAWMRAGYGNRKPDRQAAASVKQPLVIEPPQPTVQSDVLRCAEAHDWRLTITDAATDLNLSFGAAHDALEQLMKSGECTSETVDGRVVYDFEPHRKRAATQRGVSAGS